MTKEPRKLIPEAVVQLLESWNATRIFGNIEYEVDELRRDIKVAELCAGSDKHATFIADKLVVEPGKLTTQKGKAYAVYSPWLRCKQTVAPDLGCRNPIRVYQRGHNTYGLTQIP